MQGTLDILSAAELVLRMTPKPVLHVASATPKAWKCQHSSVNTHSYLHTGPAREAYDETLSQHLITRSALPISLPYTVRKELNARRASFSQHEHDYSTLAGHQRIAEAKKPTTGPAFVCNRGMQVVEKLISGLQVHEENGK
jgi:hypothetical protein